jgi:hypothetical protein
MNAFRTGVAFALALGASCACRSRPADPVPVAASDPTVPPAPPPSAAAPPPPEPAPNALDELFAGYQKELPAAASLSEQNGASLKCDHHGWVTYTLLDATARKVSAKSDEDVVRLARWARDPDVCVRQIALDVLVKKVGFDSNRLVLPDMHEPDNHLYHDIFVSVLAHLDAKQVRYSPKLVSGLMLDIRGTDFEATMRGEWRESTKGKNFIVIVAVNGNELRVTRARTEPDPKWPDQVWAGTVKSVQVNAKRQYVVSGVSSAGEPRNEAYVLWPVASNVVWFEDGAPGHWVKLRRTSGGSP